MSRSSTDAGSAMPTLEHGRRPRPVAPCAPVPRSAGRPVAEPHATPSPRHRGIGRAPVGSTGSTSRRRRASDRRRRSREHVRIAPLRARRHPVGTRPRRIVPAPPASAPSVSSTTPTGKHPARWPARSRRNGPCVRAHPREQALRATPVVGTEERERHPGRAAGLRRRRDSAQCPRSRSSGPRSRSGRGWRVATIPAPRARLRRRARRPRYAAGDLVHRRGRRGRRSRSWRTGSTVVAAPVLGERLERQLEVGECRRIEQLAQLLLAKKLAQQVAVEGQRLRPALGQRRVAVVHVRRDVVEEQRARERRGANGLDGVDGDLASSDTRQHLAQGRQVEHVREALAVRLDEDGKRAVAAGNGQ